MLLIRTPQRCAWLLPALLLLGCGNETTDDLADDPPIPVAESDDVGDPSAPTSEPGVRQFHGISFTIPAGWVPLPASQFYDAKYSIPHEAGEMQLTLTSMGGGIDLNLERWVGQFELPPGETPRRQSIDIAGLTASWIDLRGTFRNQMAPGNPGSQSDWRLLGVGLPLPERDFYLKLTGPHAAVTDFEPQFRDFLTSAERE